MGQQLFRDFTRKKTSITDRVEAASIDLANFIKFSHSNRVLKILFIQFLLVEFLFYFGFFDDGLESIPVDIPSATLHQPNLQHDNPISRQLLSSSGLFDVFLQTNQMTQPNKLSTRVLPALGGIVSSLTLFAITPQAQAASFHYSNFGNSTSLDLIGDVKTDEATLRLTEAEQEWHAAAAWHNESQDITDGFETTFQFQISDLRAADDLYYGNSVVDQNGNTGGDGFAFVIRNEASNAVGYAGGGQGYSGIANALAIEFDTWDNSQDFATWGNGVDEDYGLESSNHISVQGLTDGSYGEYPRYSLGYSDNIVDLSNGDIHEATVRYEENRLSIFLNSILALEVNDLDLGGIVGADSALLGFTSGTGAAWQSNEVLSWSYDVPSSSTKSRSRSFASPKKVPEPGSLLALMGVAGVATWKRQRLCKTA